MVGCQRLRCYREVPDPEASRGHRQLLTTTDGTSGGSAGNPCCLRGFRVSVVSGFRRPREGLQPSSPGIESAEHPQQTVENGQRMGRAARHP
jgi:hypothetical protein